MNTKYNKENLETAIKNSNSWNDVCKFFGKKPKTGLQSHLKKRAIDFGIDFSHFPGQAHAKGKTFPQRQLSAKEYLASVKYVSSHRLKLKLIRDGIKENECEKCHISKWQGEDLPLELDHINGNHEDNRLENLQILCPNCHSIKTRKER